MSRDSTNPTTERPKSAFAQKMESDPELKARFSKGVNVMREAAKEDIEAVDRSELLTHEDFAVYINARADNSLPVINDG